MKIGRVTGSIVSTQKHPSLVGKKLMIVDLIDSKKTLQDEVVAVDDVGAGIGEYVLLSQGSPAGRIFPEGSPIDCSIIGIIDSFES